MRLTYFTHSLLSCWNHGNAHFLRGILRELQLGGHQAIACEPAGSWSLVKLLESEGESALQPFRGAYPELAPVTYRSLSDVEELVEGSDVVIVHEWNEPELVARIGRLRRQARFTLLFHDTHHRAVSDPDAIRRFDLSGYDGVLAFGATLADVYRRWGWGDRVFVWHEAADLRLFHPDYDEGARSGVVWIGNWGDDERTAEIETYLLAPAQAAGLPISTHGVRYPPTALKMLARYGATYQGWLPNVAVPRTFARHLATIHVPRRFYAEQLPGIPTIRVFEALACGIPLVSAPWRDSEGLFSPGEDYLVAKDGEATRRHLVALKHDPGLREALARNGVSTVRARHTCAHRIHELLAIVDHIESRPQLEPAA
jgi:spore maturation protein CgeB